MVAAKRIREGKESIKNIVLQMPWHMDSRGDEEAYVLQLIILETSTTCDRESFDNSVAVPTFSFF